MVVGDYYGEKDIVIVDGLEQAATAWSSTGVLKVVPGQPVKIVAPGEAGAARPATRQGKPPDAAEKPADAAKK